MTQEGLIHDREFNATHQRASKTWRELRFVGTATGEPIVVQEQFHRHQPPPKEEVCQFLKLLDEKIKQQTVADLAEKLPSRLHEPPQGIKQLFEDNCFNQCQIV
jgi:hypothetical protein